MDPIRVYSQATTFLWADHLAYSSIQTALRLIDRGRPSGGVAAFRPRVSGIRVMWLFMMTSDSLQRAFSPRITFERDADRVQQRRRQPAALKPRTKLLNSFGIVRFAFVAGTASFWNAQKI